LFIPPPVFVLLLRLAKDFSLFLGCANVTDLEEIEFLSIASVFVDSLSCTILTSMSEYFSRSTCAESSEIMLWGAASADLDCEEAAGLGGVNKLVDSGDLHSNLLLWSRKV